MHHFHKHHHGDNGGMSNFALRETGHFSPAQALLHRLFPEAAEYKIPEGEAIEVEADWVPSKDKK